MIGEVPKERHEFISILGFFPGYQMAVNGALESGQPQSEGDRYERV
jgi:hypothetical protein